MKVKYPSGMCTTQCGRRKLDEMSISELEARVKMNEERLRLARQIGWLGGFGGGVVGVLGVAKMIK